MTNEGSDANFTKLIDEGYNAPIESALEFTSETVTIAPELGAIIAIGFVIILLIFGFFVFIGLLLKFLKQ